MTDRELLEQAAKAAGAERLKGTYENGWWLDDGWWNPLTDDGDALRLAVKLRMDMTDLMDMLRLIETIKYLRGIAERGLGREIRDDETIEQFVLGYVKQLEAAIRAARAQEQAEQEPQHSKHYWQHEINNARADGYERGYAAAKKLYAEQAEQEPVAWVWLDDWLNDGYPEDCFSRVNHQGKAALYAAPVRTKDLTELLDAMVGMANYIDKLGGDSKKYRAVIAADREKNK
jgi:hypothetical protein